MFEQIEVSGAYAKALLLAILPLVSDFAQRLELDVPIPITTNHVARFSPSRDPENVGGQIVLSNGYVFSFQHGHVRFFSSPHSYTSEQNPGNIAAYFGPIRLSEQQAVEMVRQRLQGLGYGLESLYADLTPQVTPPPKIDGKFVARYRIKWFTPRYDNPPSGSVSAEVNATSGAIERLFLLNQNLHRPSPRVAVEPIVVNRAARPEALSNGEARALMVKALPEIEEWVQKLELPFHKPVEANQVREISASRLGVETDCRITFTNGYVFSYYLGFVHGYSAPDSFFTPLEVRVRDFVGKWKLSQGAALRIARAAIRKLQYPKGTVDIEGRPSVKKPYFIGPPLVPRYEFSWQRGEGGYEISSATVEVDAQDGTVKRMYVRSRSLIRDLPKREGE